MIGSFPPLVQRPVQDFWTLVLIWHYGGLIGHTEVLHTAIRVLSAARDVTDGRREA